MKHVRASARRSRTFGAISGVGVVAVSLVAFAVPASADVPPPTPQTFTQCPVDGVVNLPPDRPVTTCIVGVAAQGSIIIGSLNTTFHGPGLVQGGFDGNAATTPNWAQALNGQSFSAPRQLLPKPVMALLGNPQGVSPPANSDVWVVTKQVGPMKFSLSFSGGIVTTTVIPLSFQMVNSLLGPNCFIGDATNPITLTLTTGTSGALTGTLGQLVFSNGGQIGQTIGTEVVDGLFSVPGASGCGSGGVFDNMIDSVNALPSPSGANQVFLYGNFDLAAANYIEKQLHE
jgi:hypothetical protein